TREKRLEAVKDYMVASAARIELIEFLIKQRNEPPRKGDDGKRMRPFVDTRDAVSAIHSIVGICDEGPDWPDELREWRMKIVQMMLGPTAKEGFSESKLVQLPICIAVLAATGDEKVVNQVRVREKVDAWDLQAKVDGRTVLQEAIQAECSEIACLIVRRNGAVTSEFQQGKDKQPVTQLYSMLSSTDHEQKFYREPDYVGINEPADATRLVPVRAAAARGMWSVVKALREAKCVDGHEHALFDQRHATGRTVWHDLATPEWGSSRAERSNNPGSDEQMAWAECLISKGCGHLVTALDVQKRLPLHWAAENNHHRLTSLLVELYCDKHYGNEYLLKMRDHNHFTPLELAVYHGNVETVESLVSAAAHYNCLPLLCITSSYKNDRTRASRDAGRNPEDKESKGGVARISRLIYWFMRNEPGKKELCWPCSAYHLVLLQMSIVMRGDHVEEKLAIEGRATSAPRNRRLHSRGSTAQRRRRNWNRKVALGTMSTKMMMSIRQSDGLAYRKWFLIRYLSQEMTLWIVWMLTLFFTTQSIFVGGGLSNTRMSLELQSEATSWMMNWNFEKNVVDDELPAEEEAFPKTFYELSAPDDAWTFINGVLFDNLFPEGEPEGQVGTSTYLIGSPLIQYAPWVNGDCDTLLMRTPKAFAGLGEDPDTCIVGKGPYGSDVRLPRNNRTLAAEAIANIDKDTWNQGAGVRVSFAVYHKDMQKVLVSNLEVQFGATGLVLPIQRTRIFLWMPINDIASWVYPFFFCSVFTGISLAYVGNEVKQIVTDFNGYVSDGAQLYDIMHAFTHIVLLCLLTVLTVKQAQLNVDPFSEDVYTIRDGQVDLLEIAEYAVHMQKIFGFTFFLETFNLIQMLRLFPELGPQMQAIGKTLVDAKVMQFLGFLLVCVFGCALTVRTVFGAEQKEFATVQDAFFAMYRFVWGDWDFSEIKSREYIWTASSAWGYVIFWVVTLVITGTLANVFIAIVGDRYNDHLSQSQSDWIEEVDHIMAQWFGDAFRKRHPDKKIEEVALAIKNCRDRHEHGDDSAEPETPSNDLLSSVRSSHDKIDSLDSRVHANQKRMDSIDADLKEVKGLLKDLLRQGSAITSATE
ncbi:unnamed protein product, partial [Prorocentrum cordatum]